MKYTHYFDVRIANSFESDIEDFEDAFDHWLSTSFADRTAIRAALLTSDEDTKSLLAGVVYSDTVENDDEPWTETERAAYNGLSSVDYHNPL